MGKCVLIAEDEPHIVESLRFILERGGYDVRTVTDGKDVIEQARVQGPDIIVLDVMLPGRNGFEVLKALKTDAGFDTTPVLMLTAKGQEQDRATAESLGVDAFITKPFSNRDVLDCIDRLLREHAGDAGA